MTCGSGTRPETRSSTFVTGNVQVPNVCDRNSGYDKERNDKKPGHRNQPQDVSSSSGLATHVDKNEDIVITSIRATDVTAGLRRIPAGFYTAVQHGGFEWRTENKPVSTNSGVIEWSTPIPIPSGPSSTICLGIYASFELQPMLGDGEQLRRLTITVEQLLDRSARNLPFTFFPKDGDVVSPCSSMFVTVKRWRRENSGPSISKVLDPYCVNTESVGQLEEVTNQGHSALSCYQKYGRKHDLEQSIELFEHVLNICPPDHPCRAAAQANMAMAKFIYCLATDINSSFDVSIALYRKALAARPAGHPDRPSTLVHMAAVHFARLQKQRNKVDVNHMQALLQEVMDLGPSGSCQKHAATFLLQAGHDMGPVQEGGQSPVEGNPAFDIADGSLWSASVRLVDRYERLGNLADLQQAVSLLEEAVRSTSVWDYRHLIGLSNLGAALSHRFQRLGELSDLEQAISRHRDAVDLTPDAHPDKPIRLSHLGGTLLLRFQHLGGLWDLEEAISKLKHAIDLAPVGDPFSLNHLGIAFLTRFEHLGDLSDLGEAISRLKDAVNLSSEGHPCKPVCLTNLGNSFSTRFQRLGDLSDLEEAILKHRDAVELTPDGHIRKPGHLNNLGCLLLFRFQRLGDMSDLDQAILRFGNAVDLTPEGHPETSHRLNNLGSSFLTRFQCLGELIDLERAIFTLGGALDIIPDGHPDKYRTLSNLGIAFQHRFERLNELSDLEEAVSRLRDAVHLIPGGHPGKPDSLSNLGDTLRIRFARLGEVSDVEQAISSLEDAIELIPNDHPNKPNFLNNLGNTYLVRFRRLGEIGDLEQTISRYQDAVKLTPDGDPGKLRLLCNLGSSILYRFERLGEVGDLEQAMLPYSQAARASTGATTVRFQASQEWISCARTLRHHSLLHAYSFAISLLPQLAWIGLSLTDRYRALLDGADVVRDAAAAALDAGQPETAVEWLEQGRSVVWTELFQLRSSYDELSSVHPEHARRLQTLSTALEHASTARERSISSLSEQSLHSDPRMAQTLEQEAGRHRTLAITRDKLLQEIRGLPGFERFLLHKEFNQLRALAHSGPIVILNAAEAHCDALVVLAEVDRVLHVPLPSFTLERCKGLQNSLKSLLGPSRVAPDEKRAGKRATRGPMSWESILSTLWNCVVKPVLDALSFSTPGELSHIFWCPTGPFTFLPIHAAGLYGTQSSAPGHRVSDFVVSSYVPTLGILVPPFEPDPGLDDDLRLLTVHQPPSDGQPRLPGVDTELKHIRAVVENSPSTRTTLMESSTGTVEEVLTLMKDADWVHFACHGIQDALIPTESGLCLADQRRLKLCDIISLSRPRGGLAFLSACQTATGHKDLSDEAIHLAAGMLFVGYGGVIGTMWSISDRLAPLVAKYVYEQLFRNGTRPNYQEAARALHDAVERVRDGNASFVEWLPFIHVGL